MSTQATVVRELAKARKQLLDLTTRNRLLSMPQHERARVIRVADELSDEVVRLLVREGKKFSFLARPGSKGTEIDSDGIDDLIPALDEPDDDEDEDPDDRGVASRHRDTKLQSTLTADALQKRLLGFYLDARTAIEEQGVNTLFLAVGQLKWTDDKNSEIERYAPLLLIPVELSRLSASDRFHLKALDQEPSDNLSLAAKLHEFGIGVPDFEWNDDFVPSEFFEQMARAVSSRKGWEVLPNKIALGFFSFAKFLMYRDLDPDNWPEGKKLENHELVSGLMGPGFEAEKGLFLDESNLDELVPVERLNHVVDSDSSQALAVEEVRNSRNLVIQGPPGTGKSQTITNLIATAVLDGKRVLFVAEKLAALEVVQRRLTDIGLNPLVLELHSHKANKKEVLESLKRTFELGRPSSPGSQQLLGRLKFLRDKLNSHAVRLNEPLEPSELTPIKIIGRLALLEGEVESENLPVLDSPESWSPEERMERETLLDDITVRVAQMGAPSSHPWRGVQRTILIKFDAERIFERVATLSRYLTDLKGVTSQFAGSLGLSVPGSVKQVDYHLKFAELVGKAPELDREAIAAEGWNEDLDHLLNTLVVGRQFSELLTKCNSRFVEDAWDNEWATVRKTIAAHGSSLFRVFNSEYRQALASLRSCLKDPRPPKKLKDRLLWLDELTEAQRLKVRFDQLSEIAADCFGNLWRAADSDWDALERILDWVKEAKSEPVQADFLKFFSRIPDVQECTRLRAESEELLKTYKSECEALFESLRLDLSQAFEVTSFQALDFSDFGPRLERWKSSQEELSEWVAYQHRVSRARELGIGDITQKFLSGSLTAEQSKPAFELAYYRQLYRVLLGLHPQLGEFDGLSQSRIVKEFRSVDNDRIALARVEVLSAHHEKMPREGGMGAVGLLRGEMRKKRGHWAIRKLLQKTGSATQSIKPVFMMSPLSVAQFLEPGGIEFDLVVFDEASQVDPVDAIGAIARGKQVVIVGDDRQLPPTKFFARLAAEDEEDEVDEDHEEVVSAGDLESILGLAAAKGIPSKMLRWHYRSRDQSLIQVSNHEFYGNNLFIIPSPRSGDPDMGLQFKHVPHGVFDRGKSYRNTQEAKAVASAVIKHALSQPKRSLGVAAFSVSQRDAIIDELELLRRDNPETERFFSMHPFEPFFVKNLENVQGDERDVIYISVGYAKDSSGFFAMNFGPLNRDGGERRLNVLISRAKERCEVFSSIQAEDIDLKRTNARGVVALKTFLKYAETRILGVPDPETDRGLDSPFEEAVKRAIESHGYVVHPQVGSSGFFVDLAVVNPDRPGQYLLGIECDGATYHSARSARERDRQRQAVLEDHGWSIYRIWSTDWFQRPQQELAKAIEAIENARSGGAGAQQDLGIEPNEPIIKREEKVEVDDPVSLAGIPYEEARLTVDTRWEIHEVTRSSLAEIVKKVVVCEAPIHSDEIIVRIRSAWGLGRAGRRIQDAVMGALDMLIRRKELTRAGSFISNNETEVKVRDRRGVESSSLRKPERIAPEEYMMAINELLKANHGVSESELAVGVARLFGFKSTSGVLRSYVNSHAKKMLNSGEIFDDGQFLNAGPTRQP
jgi:very-short-patch-repair endonuclease/DNA polymerase III delta prime subunit